MQTAEFLPTTWLKAFEDLFQAARHAPSTPEYQEAGTAMEVDRAVFEIVKLGPKACLAAIQHSQRIEDADLCARVVGDLLDGMGDLDDADLEVMQLLAKSEHGVHWYVLCMLTSKFLMRVDKRAVTNALMAVRRKGDNNLKQMVDYAMGSHGLRAGLFGLFG